MKKYLKQSPVKKQAPLIQVQSPDKAKLKCMQYLVNLILKASLQPQTSQFLYNLYDKCILAYDLILRDKNQKLKEQQTQSAPIIKKSPIEKYMKQEIKKKKIVAKSPISNRQNNLNKKYNDHHEEIPTKFNMLRNELLSFGGKYSEHHETETKKIKSSTPTKLKANKFTLKTPPTKQKQNYNYKCKVATTTAKGTSKQLNQSFDMPKNNDIEKQLQQKLIRIQQLKMELENLEIETQILQKKQSTQHSRVKTEATSPNKDARKSNTNTPKKRQYQ